MCRLAERQFAAELSAASEVRHWLAARLRAWDLEDLIDVSELLTTELVANAVVHAASGPKVAISVAERALEVGVSDQEPRFPRLPTGAIPAPADLDEAVFMAEGGRGLLLVDALADEWGTTSTRLGKQVWFRIHLGGESDGPGCHCVDPKADRLRLDSGRHVHLVEDGEVAQGGGSREPGSGPDGR